MRGPGTSTTSSSAPGAPSTSELTGPAELRGSVELPADDRPIGVFDSGFGGLSIVRALIDLLPDEHVVYVGDTGRYPYGPRPAEEVRAFALQIGRHLVKEEGCKLLVVACNTAASVALDDLAENHDVPVVGVVEPGMRAALSASRVGRIGVIGTVRTIASGAYQRLAADLAGAAEVFCAACPGFVEFVERGETSSDQVHVLAERLLAPLTEAGVDTLLLGCTHYPFLARTIADVMGEEVVLVSSAEETAFDVHRLIISGAIGSAAGPGRHEFYSSGDVEWFAEMGRLLLGPELSAARPVSFPDVGAA